MQSRQKKAIMRKYRLMGKVHGKYVESSCMAKNPKDAMRRMEQKLPGSRFDCAVEDNRVTRKYFTHLTPLSRRYVMQKVGGKR